jgi:tetratricopeptide (TPR) repeat protein
VFSLSAYSKEFIWLLCILVVAACPSFAQRPGNAELTEAYKLLNTKDYDRAIELFHKGLALQPDNARVHKDLAYTLLKTGENEEARDEFGIAVKLNGNDETAQLEYAFLCYETQKPIEARRMFDRLRKRGTPATRATAEQAFQNIDKPLAENIQRWQKALALSANPNALAMYSAHWELATTAELRDDLPLAAEQYEICRQLKPDRSELLLPLARVWQQLNRVEESRAALLAASRSNDSRTAESALVELGSRYPYPYEFEKALTLDSKNIKLREELAYLYLAMHENAEATKQFQQVLVLEPKDQAARDQLDAIYGFKKRTAATPPTPTVNAREMGIKSLAAGFTKDAIKYLQQAHEQDPNDAEVMLKLGWAYNAAKDDAAAVKWFDQARFADEPAIAAEAGKAFHNLNGDTLAQTTVWTLPLFSSRWHDAFTYGQVKRTIPLPWKKGNKLFSLYLSARFMGDIKSSMQQKDAVPEYFSENSFIFGMGVASKTWHHLTAWAEAGEAVGYLPSDNHDRIIPDYRGGINFAKGFGSLLGSHTPGFFYETTADADYVNRFDKDWLFLSQNRFGRTFRMWDGASAQALFNVNATQDSKHQYWANTIEMGPGIKLHLPWMPPNVYLSSDFLRGVYTNNLYNPRRPNYNDVRVGVWYAMTK